MVAQKKEAWSAKSPHVPLYLTASIFRLGSQHSTIDVAEYGILCLLITMKTE